MNVQSVQAVPAVQIVRRSEAVERNAAIERLQLQIASAKLPQKGTKYGISDNHL